MIDRKIAIALGALVLVGLATAWEHGWFDGQDRRVPSGLRRVSAGQQAADEARAKLVDKVARNLREVLAGGGLGPPDPRILIAMRHLPRHAFVPKQLAPLAYFDRPLPVGHGQTVSQPFLVALMTQLADVGSGERVLQVGIGGGYHAALLAELGARVHCIDLQDPVAEAAMLRLQELGYEDVATQIGDGYYGWSGATEDYFDAIIVRQAVHHLPPPLLAQLKVGGRLVMPVGRPHSMQHLTLVEKNADGSLTERRILPVRFTTLPGGDRI
ncbi:MAG: protein-L-isoaspartate O-methyltransferase [Alphaproteobacteria bacterium]|nr:protein-L-isoaspartate O-methyltransferase [Alphaproteobacteria bacterium]MDP6812485.1 protein-L-isoaspartate O-methyltransferase [Alphaproteobacteria bacterium]